MAISGSNNFDQLPRFDKAVNANPGAPRALCFGDSWFQYPFQAVDLNKQLARHFKRTLFLNQSVAGRDSASWKIGLPQVQRAIADYRFDAILLSGGGNDVVGDELTEFLKTPDQPQSLGSTDWGWLPPVVRDYVRLETFEHALRYAMKDLGQVVQCRDLFSAQSIVYVHTYDYIYPDGRGFKGKLKGPWVRPALLAVGLTDAAEQRNLTNWLLQQFRRVLREFVSQHRNLRLVDSLDVLKSKAQWDNEIHPTPAGFRALAEQAWVPALTGVLR
ncbi:MAG: SGNH/GDSL hydrolase family protein [Rhodanobacteraceae bacterium]|nr:SGNH/GDSL hydrolase family protein [Rhodanobacteraceae bacterium]